MAPSTPAPVRLLVLGGFDAAFRAARPLAALTRKTQALLAYLALASGRPARRDMLAEILWGLQGEERARNNLRQSLSAIRRVLGPFAPALARSGRDAVVLDPDALEVDALVFERRARAAMPDQLRSAIDLYQGDLLAGFETVAAPGFQAWRGAEAARLKSLAVDALLRLLQYAEAEEVAGAETAAVARRLLDIDPLQEPAHRALMRHYAGNAQPVLALDQYRQCRALLEGRPGVVPAPETEALRRALGGDGDAAPRAGGPPRPDGAALEVPPSVLVPPFTNPGRDPAEEVFGLGIAEEITHALARIRWLLVLARSSDCARPQGSLDDRRIGRERGTRYVLTGTIRRAGQQRRVAGRLLDVASGRHIWSGRFEGTAEDVFALQDAVTRAVLAAIEPSVERAEMNRAQRVPPAAAELYTLLFRSLSLRVALTRAASGEAVALLRQALALDPGFVPAQAHLLLCYTQRASQGWDDAGEIEDGVRLARAAFVAHGDDPYVLEAVVFALIALAMDADGALEAANRALALHPNSSWIRNAAGWANIHAGDAEAAARHLSEAIRLNPFDPEVAYPHAGLGLAHVLAHVLAGRPEEGLLARGARCANVRPWQVASASSWRRSCNWVARPRPPTWPAASCVRRRTRRASGPTSCGRPSATGPRPRC